MYLGYPAGYKCYKLLDLESQNIIISRNVLFHEDIFPFQDDAAAKNDFFSILNPASVEPCNHDDINTVNERESQTVVSGSHDNVDAIPVVERESPTVVHDILPPDSTTANIEPTCNKKTSKSPAYLHDYYCNITETDVPYPLASYVSMEKLSEGYKAYIYVLLVFIQNQPLSLKPRSLMLGYKR